MAGSYGNIGFLLYGVAASRITDGGFCSRYEGLWLLGGTWIASYEVAPEKNRVRGTLVCAWAEASERCSAAFANKSCTKMSLILDQPRSITLTGAPGRSFGLAREIATDCTRRDAPLLVSYWKHGRRGGTRTPDPRIRKTMLAIKRHLNH
jgi:hypothetical protein